MKSSLRIQIVVFGSSLSFDSHCKKLALNCFDHLRNISKLESFVSQKELETIVHAFISSYSDYCKNRFTCLNKSSLARLHSVQNAAATSLTKTNRGAHITPVLALCAFEE